jgi:hypothetical protein
MNDLTCLDALNRVHKRWEKWTVVIHPVFRDVNDHDSESQLLEIVLMLKTPIYGNQNVTLALSLRNELGVGQRPPLGFGNGQDFMLGESLPEARIDALV